jgi:hypothetical protein
MAKLKAAEYLLGEHLNYYRELARNTPNPDEKTKNDMSLVLQKFKDVQALIRELEEK